MHTQKILGQLLVMFAVKSLLYLSLLRSGRLALTDSRRKTMLIRPARSGTAATCASDLRVSIFGCCKFFVRVHGMTLGTSLFMYIVVGTLFHVFLAGAWQVRLGL